MSFEVIEVAVKLGEAMVEDVVLLLANVVKDVLEFVGDRFHPFDDACRQNLVGLDGHQDGKDLSKEQTVSSILFRNNFSDKRLRTITETK